MKLKITRTLFILVLFVPFEVLILKYLPVSDTIYGYLRFAVEVIIYLLAGKKSFPKEHLLINRLKYLLATLCSSQQ